MLNDQTTTAAPAPETDEAAAAVAEPTTAPEGASAEQLEHLLVLSQAPVSLDDALQQEADRTDEATPLTAGRLLGRYAGMLALFVGVGLITAAVRHYAAEPKLYLGLGTLGALLFAGGSIVVEPRSRRHGAAGAARYAALSALLGLGLGLLAGGILHFSAFPHTGAVLVPLGLALSAGAFIARDGRALIGGGLMSAGVTVAGLLVWLGVGLGLLAKKLDPAPTPAAPHGAVSAEHAAPAVDHGAPAEAGHGEAAKAEHVDAATAGHGEAAKSDHGAAAEAAHGEAAKSEHGEGAEAAHGEAAKAEHGAATAEHGAAADTGHGASGESHAAAEAEEDEVSAADVLVPREGENLGKH